MPTGAALDALDRDLGSAVSRLREAALAAGPSDLSAWDSLLEKVHLKPLPLAQRQLRYQQLKLSRGALPDEYRAALQVVARQSVGRLDAIRASDAEGTGHHGPFASRCGLLRARLVGLVDREGAAYDTVLRPPKPGGGLGGIFANARLTSSIDPWKASKWEISVTLSCVSCGAPQEVELEFHCHYCRNPLFREGIGWD